MCNHSSTSQIHPSHSKDKIFSSSGSQQPRVSIIPPISFQQRASSPILHPISTGSNTYDKELVNQITKHLVRHGHPVEKINKAVRGANAADIATNINGKVLHIQVLPTSGAQSPSQWKYQKLAEQCGDVYRLVHSFSSFHEVYSLLIKRQNTDYTKPAKDEDEAVAIMTDCVTLTDLKAFYLSNSALIDATARANNCYKTRRALIPFKNRHHG